MEKKRASEREKRTVRGREEGGSRRWVGECVDGRGNKGWEAKVDSGKIGKRGLKGLLRDGNISSDDDDDDDDSRKTKMVSDSAVFREIGDDPAAAIRRAKPLGSAAACRRPPANWFHQSSTTKERNNGA